MLLRIPEDKSGDLGLFLWRSILDRFQGLVLSRIELTEVGLDLLDALGGPRISGLNLSSFW